MMRVWLRRGGLVGAVVLGVVVLVVSWSRSAVAAGDDYRLYKVSSDAAALANDYAGGSDVPDVFKDVSAGDAGSFFGFYDTNVSSGHAQGILQENYAKNEQRIYYESIAKSSGPFSKGEEYVKHGAALQHLGLDKVESNETFEFLARRVLGWIVVILYFLATTTEQIFSLVLKVLSNFNPLRLFGDTTVSGGSNGKLQGEFTQIVDETDVKKPGDNAGLAEHIHYWVDSHWDGLSESGLFIVLMVFFVTFIVGLLKNKGYMQALKFFAVRASFIVAGIGLSGILFTEAIAFVAAVNDKEEKDSDNQSTVDTIILSNYVDFETWAKDYRLAPFDYAFTYDFASQTATVSLKNSDSKNTVSSDSKNTVSKDVSNDVLLDLNDTIISGCAVTVDSFDKDWSEKGISYSGKNARSISSLLISYARGETFSASSYASYVLGDSVVRENVLKSVDDKDGNRVVVDGSLLGVDGEVTDYVKIDSDRQLGSGGDKVDANLSVLAMYNYLSSDFNDSYVSVYSPYNSASAYSNHAHFSVNVKGDGWFEVLNLLLLILRLLFSVLLGWGFVLVLLWASVKRTFRTVANVPFAFLGSLKAIGKYLMNLIGFLVEVFVVVLLYVFLTQMVDFVLSGIVSSLAKFSNNATWGYLAGLLLNMLALVVLLFVGFKSRSLVVQGVDQGFEELWHRWFGVHVVSQSSGSGVSQMVKSAAMYSAMNSVRSHFGGGNSGGEGDVVQGDVESGNSETNFSGLRSSEKSRSDSSHSQQVNNGGNGADGSGVHDNQRGGSALDAVGSGGQEGGVSLSGGFDGFGSDGSVKDVVGGDSGSWRDLSVGERHVEAEKVREHFSETGSLRETVGGSDSSPDSSSIGVNRFADGDVVGDSGAHSIPSVSSSSAFTTPQTSPTLPSSPTSPNVSGDTASPTSVRSSNSGAHSIPSVSSSSAFTTPQTSPTLPSSPTSPNVSGEDSEKSAAFNWDSIFKSTDKEK